MCPVPASGMEITVPAVVYALNGTDIRLPCNFNSCYKMDTKQFSMNWTYRGCDNCTEEMVRDVDPCIFLTPSRCHGTVPIQCVPVYHY